MKWRNSKDELPPESGAIVAVLTQHPKQHNPLSCEVMFGIVEYDNKGKNPQAQSGDFTGSGSWAVRIDESLAWMPAEEFELPDWTPHNDWWKK